MRQLTIITFFTLLLFSCKTKKEMGEKKLSPSQVKKNQYTALYIKAANMASIEEYDKAIQFYEQCKELNPKNASTYYELSRLYGKKKNAQLAITNAEKAWEISPKNKWYLLQKATVYRATGQQKKAIKAYEELVAVDEKNLSVLYELADLYKRNDQYKETVNIISKIENISGKNPQMSYQKYMILMEAGEVIPALDEIADLLKQDPENGMGNLAMAQHYQKSGQEEKVYKRLTYVFDDPSIRSDTKLSILMDYTKQMNGSVKKQKETLDLINRMKKTHPKDVKSYVAAGDYFTSLNQIEKANENFEEALKYSTNSFPIFLQLLDNEFKLKNYNQVISYSEDAIESYPTQPIFYLYKGMANKEIKEYKKAISAFKTGKNVLVDDEKLLFDFYSKMGETYHELKEYDKSDQSFEKAMDLNGLEPYMLNNYSYYLSLRKVKLEKAAALSKKANNIFPNNASFNDTYGWILFQQGNYKEAEVWLKRSLKNGGDKSGTVLEHYGDVMIQLNDPIKAVEYWEKAKDSKEFSDKLTDKIRDKKYYE